VVIPVGQYYVYFNVRAQDVVGTVQVTATASGYSPATMNQEVTAARFVVQTGSSVRTTQGAQVVTVYATDAAGSAHPVNENVTVSLTSSSGTVGIIDSNTVTIVAGQQQTSAARFIPLSVGTTQLTASDPRTEPYRYQTGSVSVSVVTPLLGLSFSDAMPLGIGQWTDQYVTSQDYMSSPLLVTLARSGTAVSVPDTTSITTGQYFRYFRILGVQSGTSGITATAAGHTGLTRSVSVGPGRIDGIGGWPGTLSSDSVQVTLYPRDPAGNGRNVAAATTFTLTHSSHVRFSQGGATVTSVTVPADGNSVSFWLVRLAPGAATVSITSPNYQTFESVITVNP
jgi:hypothetical protein